MRLWQCESMPHRHPCERFRVVPGAAGLQLLRLRLQLLRLRLQLLRRLKAPLAVQRRMSQATADTMANDRAATRGARLRPAAGGGRAPAVRPRRPAAAMPVSPPPRPLRRRGRAQMRRARPARQPTRPPRKR